MMRVLAMLALFVLSACGADNVWSDDAKIMQARYVAPAPTSITLFTVISEQNGSGAHSALLVNGSEQVLFDPAGSMQLETFPERHDVLFGATPRMVSAFIDYHVRPAYRMTEQRLVVSPEIAEMILAKVKANGSVAKAHCANAISKLLSDVPGFEDINVTYFPKQLSKQFGSYPNVSFRMINDATVDTSHGVTFIDPKDKDALKQANLAK
jgi:hypothetical protein